MSQGVDFRVGADVAQFQQGLDNVMGRFRQFEHAVNGFNSKMTAGLPSLNTHLDTMSTRFTTIGTTISRNVNPAFNMMVRGLAVVTGAMGVLTGVSLRIGGDFQQAMTTVGTISQATEEQLASLTETARRMGRDLPRTAQDAAQAMTYLAQKGWDISRIQDTVADVMNLSISQTYGLAESADLLSGVMSAYKMEASQAAELTDILNNAANQSALTMEKLSYAFRYAAPVASAFGVSVKQLSSHFAVLANQNLDGSTIGAGWRMVAQRIQQAGADGGMAFRRLGVEVKNADGSMRDMTSILEDLGGFLEKSPERAAEIMKLFGMRAGTVGMILAQQASQLRSYEESLGKLGTTQDAVLRRMNDWNTVKDIFISARDDTAITYFNQLQSSLVPATKRLTDMINSFNTWLRQTSAGEKAIRALGKGFGLTTTTGAEFSQWLDSIDLNAVIKRFEDFGAGIRALGTAFAEVASAVPWQFIVNNLATIISVITGFWLTGKVMTVIGNVMQLGKAFTWLAAHPVVAGLLAVAGAIGLITNEARKSAEAMNEANRELEKSMVKEFQAEKYVAAKGGDYESFFFLDDEHQKRLLESFAKEEALIEKFSQQYKDMIVFRAKELGVQLGMTLTPQALAIQKIFDTYANEGLMVDRMKDYLKADVLEAWAVNGKQSVDAYLANFKMLPDEVRRVVGKATDEIIKARRTREDAGIQKNMLLSEDAGGQAMAKLKELSDQAQQTAKDLGVPMEQMGKEFGEKFAKAVDKILEETAEIADNPFLSTAILRDIDEQFASSAVAASEFGKAGLSAFRDIVKEADKTKSALDKVREQLTKTTEPMQVLVDAMKGGFLKGQDLSEAKTIVQKLANETRSSGAQLVKTQWEEYGISVSDSLLSGLAKSFTSKTLQDTGMEKVTEKLPDMFGDFVRTTETKLPVAENMFIRMANTAETQLHRTSEALTRTTESLSQVTVVESSSRVGEAIAKGIAQPTQTGITALDKLHQAAIRAFDAVIQKGKESTQVLANFAMTLDGVAERMGKVSSLERLAVGGQEMATPALSKGMVPKTQAAPSGTSQIDARSDMNVSVTIQHMEVKDNKAEAGEIVARAIADKAGAQVRAASSRYQRDILGALTN